MPDGDKSKKFKYRLVFQGNQVVTQNWEVALFQDLGSSPATMEAGKYVDAYGCAPGHSCEQADAEQAYVQAALVKELNEGKDVKLKKVATSFLPEDHSDAPSRVPRSGDCAVCCPWCQHSFPESEFQALRSKSKTVSYTHLTLPTKA